MTPRKLSPLFTWRSSLVDSDLAATTKHVGLTLSLHMSERGDSCFPSIATLARETTLDGRTVSNHLRELADAGWLHREYDRSQSGRGTVVTYSATVPGDDPTTPRRTTRSQTTRSQTTRGLTHDHLSFDDTTTCSETTGPIEEEDVMRTTRGRHSRAATFDDHDTHPALELVAPPAPPVKTRPRDPIFDALVDACGLRYDEMTRQSRRACGVAAGELRGVNATPEQIADRAASWPQLFPQATMTPSAIARHWAQLGRPPQRRNGRRAAPGMDALRALRTERTSRPTVIDTDVIGDPR